MQQLSPLLIIGVIVGYFILLLGVAWWTGRSASNRDFFTASRESPWYLVAFGMIGTSLSGVTFISVPGTVGAAYMNPAIEQAPNMGFSYLQMVFGYLAGYAVIALVLLPLYYRLQLTSIYTYLEGRFGRNAYKTGAGFFLVSRVIGAAFRLYLVAMVLYLFVFEAMGLPFWMVALLTIVLIWVYTFKGGIKTIVWTDTLQTLFMLIAVAWTLYELTTALDLSLATVWPTVKEAGLGQIFFFEGGWTDPNNFFKQFLAGMFIAIVMTGLDQDMMQKNLTCRTLQDAQKNVFSFSIVLVGVNFLFLVLGALLALYAVSFQVDIQGADTLYPTIALQYLPTGVGLLFLIGLVAAAYSSADSALTALTTSFCVDFLGFEVGTPKKKEAMPTMSDILETSVPSNILDEASKDKASSIASSYNENTSLRYLVHIGFSLLLFMTIVLFWWVNDESVIVKLFKYAGYTYGPLLGLYGFGLLTKRQVQDKWVPIICLLAPVLTYFINENSAALLWGYKFSFELLLLNGFLTAVGLFIMSKAAPTD
ncbi:MAG: sodium:solute symporter [Aureispira sp.]